MNMKEDLENNFGESLGETGVIVGHGKGTRKESTIESIYGNVQHLI